MSRHLIYAIITLCLVFIFSIASAKTNPDLDATTFSATILNHRDLQNILSYEDRSPGSRASSKVAKYILKEFKSIGLENVGFQYFFLPLPVVPQAELHIDGQKFPLKIWTPNMVYLSNTGSEGLSGPCLYLGKGEWKDFDGKKIKNSIVFLDLDSGLSWLYAAMHGAKAVVFMNWQGYPAGEYTGKFLSTPIAFPRYWLSRGGSASVRKLITEEKRFGTIISKAYWQNAILKNCYGFIEGSDPKLKEQLVIVEARYDATSIIPQAAPGVDEATSLLTMLNLARYLAKNPPKRTIMFIATAGSGHAAAGMREFVWSITSSSKNLRKEKRYLKKQMRITKKRLTILRKLVKKIGGSISYGIKNDESINKYLWPLILIKVKDEVDDLTRSQFYGSFDSAKSELARKYRVISWKHSFRELSPHEFNMIIPFFSVLHREQKEYLKELQKRWQVIKSAMKVRSEVRMYEPVLVVSLDISTYSPYMRFYDRGSSFPFRERVTKFYRIGHFINVANRIAREVASEKNIENLLDSRGKNRTASIPVGPLLRHCACCDITSIGGLPAVGLSSRIVTPPFWGTPEDSWEHWNSVNFIKINKFIVPFLKRLFDNKNITSACKQGIKGIASLEGTAQFIRQGELFPDRPAPGTIVNALQGKNIFRSMAFMDGRFHLHGVANKKVSYQKLILEPYGVDRKTGRIKWATDKRETGKNRYRIKIKGNTAYTTLIMFPCEQTDILGVFHPRKLSYITKVKLLDARTDSTPMKYWYSRVDGKDTIAISILLEPGARFKLILADSLITKDVLLLNTSDKKNTGEGFLIGHPPIIRLGSILSAKDTFSIIKIRLGDLKRTGIRNHFIESLYKKAADDLETAEKNLKENKYSAFWQQITSSWAFLNKIYHDVESIQKDVLLGVIFFIALFVPFAYCVERYLFCFTNIYKQITAFFIILLSTILIIRSIHPAFRLTYSPMMVIIAFFIVGLSTLVGSIILSRFEHEMELLRKARWYQTGMTPIGQIRTSQALGAGLAIGVSNLHRRKLRTALTCITLIILTFTIMSFTSVKSFQKVTDTKIGENPPYEGILLHHPLWLPLTDFGLKQLKAIFLNDAEIFTRSWIERADPYKKILAYAENSQGRAVGLEGIMGVGINPPELLKKTIIKGRWIHKSCCNEILLPESIAKQLGITLNSHDNSYPKVFLFGVPFHVVGIFSDKAMSSFRDLDGKPITPAYLEAHPEEELTEVEVEAMESGEDILPVIERFYYASPSATVLIPFNTCLALGGKIRAVHILNTSISPSKLANKIGSWFAYSFYIGEKSRILYHSALVTVRYQGVANLVIPILIVILICLNTLIGQVHERKREIAVYTSVGLAPNHVGMLFIMEALSFAVMSCVAGYLIAQFIAHFFGNLPFFSSLTFNYSSLSSIASMLMVFGVVFIASLYPARLAVNLAMPDVEKTWELPKPDGDVLVAELPFLFPENDRVAVLLFLADYINLHMDTAHGVFMSDGVHTGWADWSEIQEDSKDIHTRFPQCFLLQTSIWLAPFDFGLKQRVYFYCCPNPDEPEYVHITIRTLRLYGESRAWYRANKNFIRAIRKQLLQWHTLSPEAKEEIKNRERALGE